MLDKYADKYRPRKAPKLKIEKYEGIARTDERIDILKKQITSQKLKMHLGLRNVNVFVWWWRDCHAIWLATRADVESCFSKAAETVSASPVIINTFDNGVTKDVLKNGFLLNEVCIVTCMLGACRQKSDVVPISGATFKRCDPSTHTRVRRNLVGIDCCRLSVHVGERCQVHVFV